MQSCAVSSAVRTSTACTAVPSFLGVTTMQRSACTVACAACSFAQAMNAPAPTSVGALWPLHSAKSSPRLTLAATSPSRRCTAVSAAPHVEEARRPAHRVNTPQSTAAPAGAWDDSLSSARLAQLDADQEASQEADSRQCSDASTTQAATDDADAAQSKQELKETERARRKAAYLLSSRLYTQRGLRDALCGPQATRPVSSEIAEAVAAELQEGGAVDDLRYARDFVAAKWHTAKWSAYKLKHALLQKGVSGRDADAALQWLHQGGHQQLSQRVTTGAPDQDGPTDAAQASDGGEGEDTQGSMQAQLLEAAQRHLCLLERQPRETQRRRMASWLQRRGHPWHVQREVLETLGLASY